VVARSLNIPRCTINENAVAYPWFGQAIVDHKQGDLSGLQVPGSWYSVQRVTLLTLDSGHWTLDCTRGS